MKLCGMEIKGALLAPMAGFTDVGFRDVCARYGAGITYTEMVSAKGMYYGSEKTEMLLATAPSEKIKAIQIFGNEPDMLSRAIKFPIMDKFDIIDINMGCPVPKIVKNGEGSALLHDVGRAAALVQAVKSITNRPVTVKMRIGFRHNEFNCLALARAVEDAGADAITVHGRTREQYYSGKADWGKIGEVVNNVRIPVIANGDVASLEDYIEIKKITNADAVMIGRGILGRPNLLREIANYENVKIQDGDYTDLDIKRDIMIQINTLKEYYPDRYIYSNMKKHICYYAKGMAGVRHIKDEICRVESLESMIECIDKYF